MQLNNQQKLPKLLQPISEQPTTTNIGPQKYYQQKTYLQDINLLKLKHLPLEQSQFPFFHLSLLLQKDQKQKLKQLLLFLYLPILELQYILYLHQQTKLYFLLLDQLVLKCKQEQLLQQQQLIYKMQFFQV
eukprot:TRINITY_DN12222_c0_g2_i1.p4 TRINITY_DN12222_c0_g2~~TRINITY_DN12222_c0_g2_i1.p4  ORF type:complete len:131 (+),score=0.72 TRINITY_DN12222_c0_g2_i1:1066-1458(+)